MNVNTTTVAVVVFLVALVLVYLIWDAWTCEAAEKAREQGQVASKAPPPPPAQRPFKPDTQLEFLNWPRQPAVREGGRIEPHPLADRHALRQHEDQMQLNNTMLMTNLAPTPADSGGYCSSSSDPGGSSSSGSSSCSSLSD